LEGNREKTRELATHGLERVGCKSGHSPVRPGRNNRECPIELGGSEVEGRQGGVGCAEQKGVQGVSKVSSVRSQQNGDLAVIESSEGEKNPFKKAFGTAIDAKNRESL